MLCKILGIWPPQIQGNLSGKWRAERYSFEPNEVGRSCGLGGRGQVFFLPEVLMFVYTFCF